MSLCRYKWGLNFYKLRYETCPRADKSTKHASQLSYI